MHSRRNKFNPEPDSVPGRPLFVPPEGSAPVRHDWTNEAPRRTRNIVAVVLSGRTTCERTSLATRSKWRTEGRVPHATVRSSTRSQRQDLDQETASSWRSRTLRGPRLAGVARVANGAWGFAASPTSRRSPSPRPPRGPPDPRAGPRPKDGVALAPTRSLRSALRRRPT